MTYAELTANEVAEQTSIGAERVRQMRKSGEIDAELKGGVYLFNPSVITYINKRKERRGRKPNWNGTKKV